MVDATITTSPSEALEALADVQCPVAFAYAVWPGVGFYRQQRETVLSVRDSKETFVVAGNMLGKDYVAGYIAVSFFLRPQLYFPREYCLAIERQRGPGNRFPHTRRVVTTSVKDEHLKVLWAEIGRFITSSALPLAGDDKRCPLILNHHEVRLSYERHAKNPVNYLMGQVSAKGEGMAGHHAAYTLCVIDEASGVEDVAYTQQATWAKRLLAFGNPNPCQNFFRVNVKAGDLLASGSRA